MAQINLSRPQLEVLMRALVTAHASNSSPHADRKEMQAIGDQLWSAWVNTHAPWAPEAPTIAYNADCPACLRGRHHTVAEHEQKIAHARGNN